MQKRQIDRSRGPAKARSRFTMTQSPFFRIFVGPTLRCFALCSHVCFAPCVCAFCAARVLPTCRVFLQGSSSIARPGVCPFVQIRKLSAETWQDSQTSCAHMCTVSVVSQLTSSISLSLCESRPGVAESNHRHGRGAEEEVAQVAPSQKAAQANCKIARTLPRVTSDQNSLQQLARMWCTMQERSSSTLSCMCTPVKLDLSTCNSIMGSFVIVPLGVPESWSRQGRTRQHELQRFQQ